MMNRFKSKRRLNFLTTFLVLDVFIMLVSFKTSTASYTSTAVSNAEMQVALYAFNSDKAEGVDKQGNTVGETIDIKLGDIAPGETKYYKFKVYNYDQNGKQAETNIGYNLSVIATTNLDLTYEMYVNESPLTKGAKNVFPDVSQVQDFTDDYGTPYKKFMAGDRCFGFKTKRVDTYTLAVTMPSNYNGSDYSDLVESIKVQLESKQLLKEDTALSGMCR